MRRSVRTSIRGVGVRRRSSAETASGPCAAAHLTYSDDGGTTFDAPFRIVDDLETPIVHGSVLELTRKSDPNERTPAVRSVLPQLSPVEHVRPSAVVSGTPREVRGVFGSALELAGDYVEVPFDDSIGVGDKAFTIALWFRSSDQRVQRLVHAYNYNDFPQLLLGASATRQRSRCTSTECQPPVQRSQ